MLFDVSPTQSPEEAKASTPREKLAPGSAGGPTGDPETDETDSCLQLF